MQGRNPDADQRDRCRYYYLNSLAYNMRINNRTRKMLNMWRTEYARPLKAGRRDTRKRGGTQTEEDTRQRAKEDADQFAARQTARNTKAARAPRCKPRCLTKLESICADIYGGNSNTPGAMQHAHDTRWKTHDHFLTKIC